MDVLTQIRKMSSLYLGKGMVQDLIPDRKNWLIVIGANICFQVMNLVLKIPWWSSTVADCGKHETGKGFEGSLRSSRHIISVSIYLLLSQVAHN